MSVAPEKQAELLVLLRNPAYVRNFEPILRRLAAHGYRLTVLFEEHKQGADRPGLELIAKLRAECSSLGYEFLAPMPLGLQGTLRKALQVGRDYLRYFDPPYREADLLRARATPFVPRPVERILAAVLRRMPRLRRVLGAIARRLHGALGDDRRVVAELKRRAPGGLIVSPLVHFGSRQNGWVAAARRLGIGSALFIHGWDNLTNTGLIHFLPDRIVVWNEAQRRQAVELHGARPGSVALTGAWPYDHWFGWRVSRSRAELCRELGLDPAESIVLYACSSKFIAEHERDSVARWIQAMRAASDQRLARANVIVRPHPLNRREWLDPAPLSLSGVTIFPPNGADPVSEDAKADYFDSVAHADAVVGVNTSALIESAIVDRPALAFPAPEFRSSQDELPHFRELTGEEGVVKVSASMDEHVGQLAAVLADRSLDGEGRRHFVERFIRPHGDKLPPTERAVAEIEALLGVAAVEPAADSISMTTMRT